MQIHRDQIEKDLPSLANEDPKLFEGTAAAMAAIVCQAREGDCFGAWSGYYYAHFMNLRNGLRYELALSKGPPALKKDINNATYDLPQDYDLKHQQQEASANCRNSPGGQGARASILKSLCQGLPVEAPVDATDGLLFKVGSSYLDPADVVGGPALNGKTGEEPAALSGHAMVIQGYIPGHDGGPGFFVYRNSWGSKMGTAYLNEDYACLIHSTSTLKVSSDPGFRPSLGFQDEPAGSSKSSH